MVNLAVLRTVILPKLECAGYALRAVSACDWYVNLPPADGGGNGEHGFLAAGDAMIADGGVREVGLQTG